eukprot:CAMPEP_0117566234 /NCGR_PEP_ID=MMETSP0784-20121206/56987_1 /TAXON_ID=39447 /ORGANISM="" /LENGTH=138 /DNA_ID=CAMNT_0005364069 /DNA_START=426 /DNA_END=843 /DNA_ORIENTATION=+
MSFVAEAFEYRVEVLVGSTSQRHGHRAFQASSCLTALSKRYRVLLVLSAQPDCCFEAACTELVLRQAAPASATSQQRAPDSPSANFVLAPGRLVFATSHWISPEICPMRAPDSPSANFVVTVEEAEVLQDPELMPPLR